MRSTHDTRKHRGLAKRCNMAKILVVDDSATVRAQVLDFFLNNNLEADIAVDGEEAFARLSSDNDYRLALVDVNMPKLDGLTLAEKVQAELELDKLSIIILTTEFEAELKERGRRAGVRGWIIKPFNGERVIGAIRKILEN